MSKQEGDKDGQSPIELSASRIRASVSAFVTQELHDAFPKNYVYHRGNYNRVFVVIEGYGNQHHGFFERGRLITLDPDGQFRTGEITQYVGDDTHSWKFHDAQLSSASDMEVVRYAPLLVASLFNQIGKELKEGKIFKEDLDAQKREKWSAILQRRDGEIFAVLAESQNALIETGENPEIPSSGAQDYGSLAMAGLDEMIKRIWGKSRQ